MAKANLLSQDWQPDRPGVLELLRDSAILDIKLLQSGSNYVFVVWLDGGDAGVGIGIYKPLKGEAPLWDYPGGSLYKREVAAHVMSELLGVGLVPPTIVRDGPHGIGSVQLFIEHDPNTHFFTFRDTEVEQLQRMAAFDALINNGDRKGGHCLLAPDGRIWGIDHGLTFHHQNKLRTVIWDWAGEPLPDEMIETFGRFRLCIERDPTTLQRLSEFITREEVGALRQRLDRLLKTRRFPEPGNGRAVPWPPV
jgi:uncharacterized repeat protein (TIGR03843 family)